jgi:CDP-alcohol phosphatidyltransferase
LAINGSGFDTNRLLQITLSGFAFVVINFLTMLWYNPTLDRDCPPWVYFSWAFGLWLYQTFDAVDGMQAYVLAETLMMQDRPIG